jgi:hypothetical protein
MACQHLISGTNLSECDDQNWFKVEAIPVLSFCWMYDVFGYPLLKTTGLDHKGSNTFWNWKRREFI